MRSILTKEIWTTVYELLDKVSPVDYDCGTLCGAACCSCADGEEELGMYLLPNEHLVHERPEDPGEDWLEWTVDMAEDYDFPDSWKGPVFFVNCKTPPHCPRKKRPMQCRTFPLRPYLNTQGELELIAYDGELPYTCPLLSKVDTLNEDFYKATYEAWSILMQDPLVYDLVAWDSMDMEDEEEALEELYGVGRE